MRFRTTAVFLTAALTLAPLADAAESSAPVRSQSSLGSSELSGPLFAPLLSSDGRRDAPSSSTGSGTGPDTAPDTGPDTASTSTAPGVDHGPEPKLLETRHVEGNYYQIVVWSPANKAEILNDLLLPGDGLADATPRPTLFLLAGAHGGEGGVNWHTETDYEAFFADKHVNVVSPLAGGASMYADWRAEDPSAGINQWATYVGEELPAIMEQHFHGTGRDGVAGCSMTGGPSLNIAGRYADRFVTAGSLSGYPAQSGLVGRIFVEQILRGKGGDSANMYGSHTDPDWRANDPTWNPWALKDTKVFVATSLGIPTLEEWAGNWPWGLFLEVLSQYSTNYYYRKALDAGVDVTRFTTVFGAHTYSNFEQELYEGWDTVFGPALGVD